jgi:hypothetical protein
MSGITEIQNVVIIDNKNTGNYTKMIDLFKPKDATKCFISVAKFEASVDVEDDYIYATHNVVLFVAGTQSSYTNDPSSGVIVRSQIIDSFMTSTFKVAKAIPAGANVTYAVYSQHNNQDNWIQVNMGDLNSFRIFMKTASNQSDMLGNIQYSDVSDNSFQFFLHLRVKFE